MEASLSPPSATRHAHQRDQQIVELLILRRRAEDVKAVAICSSFRLAEIIVERRDRQVLVGWVGDAAILVEPRRDGEFQDVRA